MSETSGQTTEYILALDASPYIRELKRAEASATHLDKMMKRYSDTMTADQKDRGQAMKASQSVVVSEMKKHVAALEKLAIQQRLYGELTDRQTKAAQGHELRLLQLSDAYEGVRRTSGRFHKELKRGGGATIRAAREAERLALATRKLEAVQASEIRSSRLARKEMLLSTRARLQAAKAAASQRKAQSRGFAVSAMGGKKEGMQEWAKIGGGALTTMQSLGKGARSAAGGMKSLFNSFSKMSFQWFLVEQGIRQIGILTKAIGGLAYEGGKVKVMTDSFERMNRSISRVDLSQLAAAVNNTISDRKLMEMANLGRSLGIAGDDISRLAKISKAAGQNLGMETEQLYSDVIRGTARYSKRILDNLGIRMENLSILWKKTAKKLNKTTGELTEGEKNKAFVEAVIANSQGILAGAGEGYADVYEQIKAQTQNHLDSISVMVHDSLMDSGALDRVGDNLSSAVEGAFGDMSPGEDLGGNVEENVAGFVDTMVDMGATLLQIGGDVMVALSPVMNLLTGGFKALGVVLKVVGAAVKIVSPAIKVLGQVIGMVLSPLSRMLDYISAGADGLMMLADAIAHPTKAFETFADKAKKAGEAHTSAISSSVTSHFSTRSEKEREEALERFRKMDDFDKGLLAHLEAKQKEMLQKAKKKQDEIKEKVLKQLATGQADAVDSFMSIMNEQMRFGAGSNRMGLLDTSEAWLEGLDEYDDFVVKLAEDMRMKHTGDTKAAREELEIFYNEVYAMADMTVPELNAAMERLEQQFPKSDFIRQLNNTMLNSDKELTSLRRVLRNMGNMMGSAADLIKDPPKKRGRRKRKPALRGVMNMIDGWEIDSKLLYLKIHAANANINRMAGGMDEMAVNLRSFMEGLNASKAWLSEWKEVTGIADEADEWFASVEELGMAGERFSSQQDAVGMARKLDNAQKLLGAMSSMGFTTLGMGDKIKRQRERVEAEQKKIDAQFKEEALGKITAGVAVREGVFEVQSMSAAWKELNKEAEEYFAIQTKNHPAMAEAHQEALATTKAINEEAYRGAFAERQRAMFAAAGEAIREGKEKLEEANKAYQDSLIQLQKDTIDALGGEMYNVIADRFALAIEEGLNGPLSKDTMDSYLQTLAGSMQAVTQQFADYTQRHVADAVSEGLEKSMLSQTGEYVGGYWGKMAGGIAGSLISGLGRWIGGWFGKQDKRDNEIDKSIKRIAEKKRDITVNLELNHHGLAVDDRTARQVYKATKRAIELGEPALGRR